LLAIAAVVLLTLLILQAINSFPDLGSYLISSGLGLLIVFSCAFLLESKYIPYVGVLPSFFFLYFLMDGASGSFPWLLKAYIDVGLILGIAAYVVYYRRKDKGPFYDTVFYAYSLKTVFPLYISYFMLRSFTHQYFAYSFIVTLIFTWLIYMEAGI
jgi:hypothetical protein